MVYELMLGGVLSSVMVPTLVRAAQMPDGGLAYTQRVLSRVTVALVIVSLAAVACAAALADLLVPPHLRHLTAIFGALLLPEILFYGLAALATAVLNVRGKFASSAWAPALNNVAVCIAIVGFWLVPGPRRPTPVSMSGAQIAVLGAGTTIGVVAQTMFLLAHLRRTGYRWKWQVPVDSESSRRTSEFRAAVRSAFCYVLISQVGVVAVQRAGSYNGHLTTFANADLLLQIPFGVIVVSYLTAVMPSLSAAAAGRDLFNVRRHYAEMCRVAIVTLLPIAGFLIVLGRDIGVMVFGGAAFGRSAATYTGGTQVGWALATSAWGLVPFALVMIQLRVFYALHDLRTPVLINIGMVATKLGLILGGTRISALRVEWLNIATSASYLVGAVVGHIALSNRFGRGAGERSTFRRPVIATASASTVALMVVVAVHTNEIASWRASAITVGLAGTAWLVALIRYGRYAIATLRQTS